MRRRLRRSFDAVRVSGLDEVRRAATTAPLIFLGNHTAWWDGLVVFHLFRTELGLDTIALMDAGNLRRVPFFTRIGGFGVERGDPRDVLRGLRHAARHLDQPGRAVVVFPQGRERPVTARPLGFQRGAERLGAMARGAAIVPFALRYEHGAVERPAVHVALGEPRRDAPGTAAIEAAVTGLLDGIDEELIRDGGRPTAAALWPSAGGDPLATRLLARLTRP